MYQCPFCDSRIFRICGTRTVGFSKKIVSTITEESYDTMDDQDEEVLEEDWSEMWCTGCRDRVEPIEAATAFREAQQQYRENLPDPRQLSLLTEA